MMRLLMRAKHAGSARRNKKVNADQRLVPQGSLLRMFELRGLMMTKKTLALVVVVVALPSFTLFQLA